MMPSYLKKKEKFPWNSSYKNRENRFVIPENFQNKFEYSLSKKKIFINKSPPQILFSSV